ncbi:MAG: hypothetical protein ABSA07_11905 [Acidimicrobiales bacterium]
MKNAYGNAVQSRVRIGAVGLMLFAFVGVQLAGVLPSSAATVSNPAMATVGATGRFTSEIVFDGGIITVRPAPANARTLQGIGAVTAKIWASAQLTGFSHQTLGWGYVTMKGSPQGEAAVTNVLGWVGFANGNTPTGCTKDSAGKYGSNGEAAVFLGDANFSQAISYVPAGCGLTGRTGYRVPQEVVSEPWVKVSTANAHGVVGFKTQIGLCGVVTSRTIAKGTGSLEVLLYSHRPDWAAKNCAAKVLTVRVPVAKTAATANAMHLLHGVTGPVRQVVNAG